MLTQSLRKIFSQIPPENMWYFVVDGCLHTIKEGPKGYEQREANSIEGVLKGLTLALNDVDKELTVEQILATHKACMAEVKSTNPSDPGIFRKTAILSLPKAQWVTLEGIRYFLNSSSPRKPRLLIATTAYDHQKNPQPLTSFPLDVKFSGKIRYIFERQLKLQDLNDNFKTELSQGNIRLAFEYNQEKVAGIPFAVDEIIKTFNHNIKKAKSEIDKLYCIAVFAQDMLRQEHPFRDGNNRVFVNCIVVRLLVKHLGKIAIFYDPNVFELHSPGELVMVLHDAIEKADDMLNDPKASLFGYDNAELDKKFIELGQAFLNGLLKTDTNEEKSDQKLMCLYPYEGIVLKRTGRLAGIAMPGFKTCWGIIISSPDFMLVIHYPSRKYSPSLATEVLRWIENKKFGVDISSLQTCLIENTHYNSIAIGSECTIENFQQKFQEATKLSNIKIIRFDTKDHSLLIVPANSGEPKIVVDNTSENPDRYNNIPVSYSSKIRYYQCREQFFKHKDNFPIVIKGSKEFLTLPELSKLPVFLQDDINAIVKKGPEE